ncbi:hypothetical protein BDV96DRAFT_651351 [Lophiotrema nucula]|uniref:Protein YAE1 n=1 Tax=Lophiotrema nucula TaxID=690887 RepID=A0A6A5YST8_9PLEO|nr:hypothetical protein BDV96DRAFT_651351 [Lophiotrema nucula]
MFRDASPALGPSRFSSMGAPPSPPHSMQNDLLDDVYGSAPASPASPAFTAHDAPSREHLDSHEILSDLPSRQRALDTDAYREGLANSKGQYVQEGFDEGYSLGANVGQRVGYVLGVLQGLVGALRGNDATEASGLLRCAQNELAIQELLGTNWVDEEGIWKWEVNGADEEVTFREVAEQHPVVRTWLGKVDDIAQRWGVDLKILHDNDTEELKAAEQS